ncbi:hypothetical protein NLG97_g1767 [Lecanicillium saksenae]|uniref:Uncharacterized protein n=1 Tax=Lecanicillium saksenae TaxID=468837 RepID=A0ACC1R2V0_9HYPO|nr:hypothetical protein NLG97_g1767 [Lecanicillium saksenae]
MQGTDEKLWYLKSTRPVLFPQHEALTQSQQDFEKYLATELELLSISENKHYEITTDAETKDGTTTTEHESSFLAAVHSHYPTKTRRKRLVGEAAENKTLTANGDVTNFSTNDDLVDLFHFMTNNMHPRMLKGGLDLAWKQDPLATLKIIFNARSIHLGKSARKPFYMAAGWLAQNHPHTLIANLPWLCRPVIEKKGSLDGEDDFDVIEMEKSENDAARFDVTYGLSHGYWKDLLNILVLAVNRKLDGSSDPADVLNVEDSFQKELAIRNRQAQGRVIKRKRTRGRNEPSKKTSGNPSKSEEKVASAAAHQAKLGKKGVRAQRHGVALNAFESDPFYRTLHLAVARLFATQLQLDIQALQHGDAKSKRMISLCAKWAPSDDHFHERHTFIISSIAETLYPRSKVDSAKVGDDRETYLRYARELYRRDVSALRKFLDVVERKVSTKTYDRINYSKVPSLAMDLHKNNFIQNDTAHFADYLTDVAGGKKSISGATLLPSTIIKQLRENHALRPLTEEEMKGMTADQIVKHKKNEMNGKILEGQWKTLVERVKQSGGLESSIAVCDVSGSMAAPIFMDGTRAIDAAIGLSMLVAETTKSPFTGSFITFSSIPQMIKLDLSKSLAQRHQDMNRAHWSMNTNVVSVFQDLILPAAIENKVPAKDMIKRVFIFSDMQFDAAQGRDGKWESSYEVVQEAYAAAGYDMPELIFWDLTGGRYATRVPASLRRPKGGLESTKPVTAADVGTALVSGYSQGMLKVFMDGGSLREEVKDTEEDIVIVEENDDGDSVVVKTGPASKMTPRSLLDKAIAHPAYNMLAVYD